jgi:HEAT repeat protein
MDSQKIDALLGQLQQAEPVADDLGTPVLAEPDAVQQLVAMGPAAVPLLVQRLEGDRPPKEVAYVALVLGRIGDPRAVAPLKAMRDRYGAREPKDRWSQAAIGQANAALERLTSDRSSSPSRR